jgi:UDP-galactopyranose mutase
MSIQKNSLFGSPQEGKKRNPSREGKQCKEFSGLTGSKTRIHMGCQSSTEESQWSAVHVAKEPALLVFSHLRWHFVTQRPQHLLTRAAQSRHVYFWEEPWFHEATDPDFLRGDGGSLEFLQAEQTPDVTVIRPHFNHGEDPVEGQRRLLNSFLSDRGLEYFDSWFYTPMALSFTAHLHPRVTVYDCMDELSAFLGAPPELIEREKELFRVADVIFTGGRSIYEAKRAKHPNVHAFPSSIDVPHFAQARTVQSDPSDQAGIPRPRVGFFGVLDERFDSALVSEVARLRPDVHFVLLGPVVKIDSAQLPKGSNIHYLGSKSYAELPRYLAGWDAAIMPFAMNDSTRFISPTKTPEYLAAGKRVVSTPIKDVVTDYGIPGLVEIAGTAAEFATALDRAISTGDEAEWTQRVERKLAQSSWDLTWAAMRAEIDAVRSCTSKDVPAISNRKFSSASIEAFDYLVVGAGFAGSVVAERLASELGKRVLVIDKRPHIGGNTYDYHNKDGVLVHRYGPHIFHTSSQKVVDYLSQFTEWRPYEHRVLAQVDGKLLPIPINLDTINGLYGLNLDSLGMEKFLAECAEPRMEIRTSEDIVVSKVGRELYEKFFRNYTRKQWGLDPSELDSSVAGRIPVRFDRDDRYFSDSFQAMPLEGFTRLFERMLDHRNINVALSTNYRDVMSSYPTAKVVYTGPIDEFFDYRFGPLPYRSLRFEHQTHDTEQFQPAAVVNYPNDHDYTRITEFKHLTGQRHEKTSIVYEYPADEGEPYYPIPRPENTALYERYRALASAATGVYFCGRLANYRYFNMDQVVAQALHMYRNIADEEAAKLSIQIPARMLGRANATAQATT